jgi:hypothetical protein
MFRMSSDCVRPPSPFGRGNSGSKGGSGDSAGRAIGGGNCRLMLGHLDAVVFSLTALVLQQGQHGPSNTEM